MPINLSGSLELTGSLVISGSITTTGPITISGSIASSSFAATASSADNFLTRGTLTAQTLVVQTITSSVLYSSGSNVFGNNIANTQVLTGSVTVTGSLAVVTNGTEFQVTSTGVNLGNALTDTHNVTGSLRVTGSITSQGGFILGNSHTIAPTGSIGYNNAIGVYLYGKSGSEADFRLYNASGLTAMSVVAGTQNVSFNGNITAKVVEVVAGTSAVFSFSVDQQSTFAFGSLNGKRVGIIRDSTSGDNGLQFGYDTTDKTGIIAGAGTSVGCGIDFYTYNGSAWGNRMRITNGGKLCVQCTNIIFGDSANRINGVSNSGGQAALEVSNSGTTDASPALNCYKENATTTSDARFIQFYAGAGTTAMGGIVGNGTSNVQFAAISDVREKENIIPINGSLEKILALNPVKFDWIKTREHTKAGFIAQEVEQIFPEYVVENMSNEGEETRKGLTGGLTSGINVHLVKAIQELTARVQYLENK